MDGKPSPYRLLNGNWSYINLLDAIGSWGLVSELKREMGVECAASFKHTSPAGAAIEMKWHELSEQTRLMMSTIYGLSESTPTSVLTYARTRNADPQSSFGDFIAFSGIVDEDLAYFVSNQISDGMVAAGYTFLFKGEPELTKLFRFTEKAIEILTAKKKGLFVVIAANQRNTTSASADLEFREVGGVALAQPENKRFISGDDIKRQIPTQNKNISDEAIRDLVLANACIKFAQSNNVACTFEGQLIGIASGQQSRIDAVKLMCQKVRCWLNRHNKSALEFFKTIPGSRQQRIIDSTFLANNPAVTTEWKPEVSVASDAFFPFSDNIEELSKINTKYVSF